MSDLLTIQSKLVDLNKKARELSRELAHHIESLRELKSGEYDGNLQYDPQFVTRNIARHGAEIPRFESLLATTQAKIVELEALRPEVDRYLEILVGLKGSTLELARNAIEIVIASEEQGTWIPHGSRKVRGLVEKKGQGENWVAFREAVKALDESRNRAVFIVDLTKVSPTVRKTLDGLDLNSETIRVCPIKYIDVTITLENGKEIVVQQGLLNWPEETRHGCSRFHSTNTNFQCQACGHAIHNMGNWVPVLVDNKAGNPHSLWVGRDCARNLFGIELKGALNLVTGQR